MKANLLFPLLICCGWGTLVVKVPFDQNREIKSILTLDNELEVTNEISFCIRFRFKGHFSNTFIFSGENESLALRIDPIESIIDSENFGTGFVTINGIALVFKIPSMLVAYKWIHFCFSFNGMTYQVIVDGQLWYQGYNEVKPSQKYLKNHIFLGSNYRKFVSYRDFVGETSELNIWSKYLTGDILMKVVKSCSNLEPSPDILHWPNVTNEMLKGNIGSQPIDFVCYNYYFDNDLIYKVIPLLEEQKSAIKVCEGLKAKLAYPKTQREYKNWSSKFEMYFKSNSVESNSYLNNI